MTEPQVDRHRVPIQDIYRALQARLDSYRQSSSTIVAGTFAFFGVFDAAIFRQDGIRPWILLSALAAMSAIATFACRVLKRINEAFDEMSEQVVKIETSSGYYGPGCSSGSDFRLPSRWQRSWTDFIVGESKRIIESVLFLHVVLLVALLLVQVANWSASHNSLTFWKEFSDFFLGRDSTSNSMSK